MVERLEDPSSSEEDPEVEFAVASALLPAAASAAAGLPLLLDWLTAADRGRDPIEYTLMLRLLHDATHIQVGM